MSWDLRSKYTFDASESQIAEGNVSPYGHGNDHANCVPASFTAALDFAGYGDIDPQQVTHELYGDAFRDGYGTFDRMLQWIAERVPAAPAWTHTMSFDFAAADRAGQAGQLIVVAGWVDPNSVTFIPGPASWSHASLLVAHQPDDSFVIWNTWTGQLQTYSRAVLAASLYEMAIMAALKLSHAPRRATAMVASSDAINLFGRGTDNALWHLRYDGGSGKWSGWQSLGGILVDSDIAVTQRGDQIDVFVIGGGRAVYHIWSTDVGVTWSQFEPQAGELQPGSLVAIASTAAAKVAPGGLSSAQDALLNAIGGDVAVIKRLAVKDLAP